MERIKEYIKNKKEKFGINKIFKLNYCTSILKLTIALALFFIAAVFVLSADVIVQNGALNISNNLLVNTNTLFVDSANNRVGIGTTSPSNPLQVNGIINSQSASNVGEYRLGGSTALDSTGGTLLRINQGGFTNVAIPNGNVGIGTASPTDKLHISGGNITLDNTYGIRIYRTGGTAAYTIADFSNANVFRLGDVSDTGWNTRISGAEIALRTAATDRIFIGNTGLVGIGTTTPNQRLMVAGNANITGTLYYGALQANSPVLERTAEPFVARCTIADDGKLVVEYIHGEAGIYSKVIEAINPDSTLWYHRSCFEKNEKFKFLDSLNNNSITIDDIVFDWNTKTAFIK